MEFLIDVAIGAVAATSLLAGCCAAALLTVPRQAPGESRATVAAAFVRSLEPRRVGLVLAAGLAILVTLGAATHVGDADLPAFVPNEEWTAPALWSSLLLCAAGGVALGARSRHPAGAAAAVAPLGCRPGPPALRRGLGCTQAAGGADGTASRRRSGYWPWGAAGWVLTYRLLGSTARKLCLAAGSAWVISQLTDPMHGVDWKGLIEEALGMTGSTLFLCALLLAAHATTAGEVDGGKGIRG